MSEPNWANRTIWTGDNLDIMRGMNSASIDLIYLDPPFKSDRTYAAPIGSEAAGAFFKDTWTLDDVDEAAQGEIRRLSPALWYAIEAAGMTHSTGMKAYLIMMTQRLLEMHRILKLTGNLYLHCDPTASHYLKSALDGVFGKENFRNEVLWCYKKMPTKANKWQSNSDHIFYYTRSDTGHTFNVLRGEYSPGTLKTYESARRVGYNANQKKMMVTIFDEEKYKAAVKAGKIPSGMRERYYEENGGPPMANWWSDIKILGGPRNKERIGYPTQKPLNLLKRIIFASSNPGDVVLDPFCGCATACVAAEQLEREWVGIDLSSKAAELVKWRMQRELGTLFPVDHRTDIPRRTDRGPLPPYRTQKHPLYGTQEGRCAGCCEHFQFRNLTVDHVVPVSKGGDDHIDNLQLLCSACNSMKGARSQAQFHARLRRRGLRPPGGCDEAWR